MSSTPHYNQKTDIPLKENENLISFSFSLIEPQKASPEQLLGTVKSQLQGILNERFNDSDRRRVDPKVNRLNFACPYCGDSYTDAHKKRGNIYTHTYFFKCYNCGKYRNLEGFLKDFNRQLTTDELILAREFNESGRQEQRFVDPMVLHDIEELTKWSINRTEIEEKFNLVQLDRTKIFVYLKKRLQPDLTRFSWSPEREQLYIFHLIPNTNRVLGYQIRNFKATPKYLTFKLSRIYEELGRTVTDEVLELDEISSSFGILEMDISQPVTVFEGPLDAFLYKNSIATCSSNIDSPIQLSTLRYMYDFDKAGRDAALEKLHAGRSVFLWKKLFSESGIEEPMKKMDLTDLLVLCKRKSIKLPRLSNFFSNDKYDAYWI
jgi:hypothetical protein